MRLKWTYPLFAVALLLAVDRIALAASPSETARSLVRTMSLDRSALLGMRLSMEAGARNGTVAQAELDCAHQFSSAVFTEVLASAIQAALTEAEMRQAQEFYSSETGIKSIAVGIRQLYEYARVPPPDPAPTIGQMDLAATDAFSRTSAGNKLLIKRVLNAPEVSAAVNLKLKELLRSCGLPKAHR